MFIHLNKKGQSTLEYGVIIAIIVASLIAMQVYIKRGVQGKLKQAADDIGAQFSPGYTTSNYSITTNLNSTETVTAGANPISSTTGTQTQSRTGSENVKAFDQEYWKK